MTKVTILAFLLATLFYNSATIHAKQPNILFILTDDQGYYDFGYRGSDVLTPHIDELAATGVKLQNYYVQPICTPSRSALLTGRYPIHTGMQNSVLKPNTAFGVPLQFPLISEQLRDLGYATHLVGKWHSGFYKKEYTPTSRGFDTFFGLYNGAFDFYTKIVFNLVVGYDLQFNVGDQLNVARNNTEYATTVFANTAVDIINEHDQEKPLFLYMAFNAPHTPLQVPQEYLDMYSWITDNNRQTYNAMLTCMDDGIKSITNALKEQDMFDNTIIIYSSDNGGNLAVGGSNWPLRGAKNSYYEGGIKAAAFVSSPLLSSPGTVNNELMHITDWYPTLVHLAGGSTEGLEIDGFDIWDSINKGEASPRKELLHTINPLINSIGQNLYPDIFDVRVNAAIRVGDWKLMTGNQGPGVTGNRPPLPPGEKNRSKRSEDSQQDISKGRPKRQLGTNLRLYNVADDPLETINVSDDHPEVVVQLLERLAFYNSTAWEAVDYDDYTDPDYDPANKGGAHFPWL